MLEVHCSAGCGRLHCASGGKIDLEILRRDLLHDPPMCINRITLQHGVPYLRTDTRRQQAAQSLMAALSNPMT